MNEKKRVVITGMGVVTALGLDETTLWNNMLAGRSGIQRIQSLDVSCCEAQSGSEVDSNLLSTGLRQQGLTAMDRTVDMALVAVSEALHQSGILPSGTPPEPHLVGTIFGTGAGCSHALYNTFSNFFHKGTRGVRPTSVPRCMANAISSQISMKFKLTGPNYVVVSACTSSTTAIGIGYRMIRNGYAEQVLCGGTDAPFDPLVYAGWNNLGVMSKNPDPKAACRPFDRNRDGCVLGEGAAALVLESLDSAQTRRARIRGEILGYGESSDASHITRPDETGQTKAIRAALESAGVRPDDIGFINAHGTATKANDDCECRSIRSVFSALADNIPVASNKSFFGHTLGACGALETVVTILGLEAGQVPPNLNLDNPDPACDVRFVGATPMATSSPLALKNTFGFGGNNAVLVLRRYDDIS